MFDDCIVFNRGGKVTDGYPLSLFDKKRTVVTYLDIRTLGFILDDTPIGKIDWIINNNPDWDFLFVIDAQLEDSSAVIHKLNQYGCDFPVIFDANHEFKKRNHLDNFLATSFIYKKNKIVNLGVIGSSRSFFDEEFDSYKKRIER